MHDNVKIGIIGGDVRQNVLCRRLSENGFEIASWGLGKGDIGRAVRCVGFENALKNSKAVILPLPAFKDGKYSIISQCTDEVLSLAQLLYTMPKDALLLCGKADTVVRNSARDHGIELVDYYENEELQIKNAIPTAEGAIEIAMRELPITLNGCRALICGYGRIGKVLSHLLKALGAKVYVSARKESDLAYISAFGNTPVRYESASFLGVASTADVIFNTVPFSVIDKTVIENMKRCKLIVDLASGKGGVDFEAALKKQIKSIHALALPSKVAPITAGEILGDCINTILVEKGVLSKQ